MRTLWSRFREDRRAAAAVEMALIAPVLAVLAITSFTVWDAATRGQDMRVALKTGAQYYMNGGLDDAAAQSVTMSAWQNAPSGASVVVTRSCYCVTTPQSCSILCAGNTPPSVYATLTAKGSWTMADANPNLTETRVVRVR